MMNTIIREVENVEDLSIIRNIAQDIWPKTFAQILSPEQIIYMMEMMYSPAVMAKEFNSGTRFAILYIDQIPAGYISFGSYHDDIAKLHKIYLLQEFHHQNFGKVMLDYVADACRAQGFKWLYLNVNKHNENALKAYQRRGYKMVEAVKNDIGNGFFMDDFVMALELWQ